jgi:AraC family transcriptional regulator of adaptative response/methylated-DNA-[protein]-cysteine methyltransferase
MTALAPSPQVKMTRQATEEMRFAIADSALGRALVARSAKGVSAVLLGDDDDALRGDLARRFPNATLVDDPRDLAADTARVIALIDAPNRAVDVRLDLRGSAFQRRVWDALREIPAGTTETYTDIAQRLGMPTAARAVARACATNPVAVLVPCHRVVRRDGDLSGYRWGLERKRALLHREQVA